MSGKIRIVGGHLRGRKISVQDAQGLRPTSDRMRETLFNWLGQDLTGKKCLDVFAGTGILGIEALSRGAKQVDFVEKNAKLAQSVKNQVNLFSLENARVYIQDAWDFLTTVSQSYDIIFCDPPFYQGRIDELLTVIKTKAMNDTSVVYLETEKGILIPEHWQVMREKQTQQAVCRLLCLVGGA